ncbi:MAG: hypothetical protein ACREIF_03915, partial [Chthoniobacterales bacterium]
SHSSESLFGDILKPFSTASVNRNRFSHVTIVSKTVALPLKATIRHFVQFGSEAPLADSCTAPNLGR